uniref:Putative ovule protein n=1 Tax=Solanum chacoense TaxID=4108 RepID=A0A0V0HE43_SOLCH
MFNQAASSVLRVQLCCQFLSHSNDIQVRLRTLMAEMLYGMKEPPFNLEVEKYSKAISIKN